MQSEAVRQATGSEWTHVGVVVKTDGRLRVAEAAGRNVGDSSLPEFVARSKGRYVAVMRLKDAERRLTPAARRKFHESLRRDYGKEYDRFFEWSDKRIYCSELAWRAYHSALGISVGRVQKVGDLGYLKPAVQALIAQRYQNKVEGTKREDLLKELIITPAAMRKSELLELVFEGEVRQ